MRRAIGWVMGGVMGVGCAAAPPTERPLALPPASASGPSAASEPSPTKPEPGAQREREADEPGQEATSNVSRRLAPAVIQRTVRAEYGTFRQCYEAGLARNPTLEGKVVVRFVIDRKGFVQTVTLEPASTMPDEEVSRCILAHWATLRFEEPEGGNVTVVYPIQFSPSASTSASPEALSQTRPRARG